MTADDFLRIVEALAWPLAFVAVTTRFIAEWDNNKRRDREARLERVRVREHLRGQTAIHVAQVQLQPAETPERLMERYAVEILRTVVSHLGGIPGKESSPGQTSRGIVRELRALADEVANPTPAPGAGREGVVLPDPTPDEGDWFGDDDPETDDPYAAAIQEGLL